MKLALLSIIALLIVGCNDTKTIEVDGNSSLEIRQTFIADCDDVTTIHIKANDGNVTVDDNNSYDTTGYMDIMLNVVVDCNDTTVCDTCDTNITEDDDNGTD